MTPINNSYLPLQKHEKCTHAHNHSKTLEERARTTCLNILLCKEAIRLTMVKLDGFASNWHNTNIGVVCGNRLRMSTSSKNQSSVMGAEDYFV
ncbi:hypothetical protein AAG906_038231 [Vitis piasezkii]